MTNSNVAELVTRAEELRRQCAGRVPHSVPWKFHAFVLGTLGFTWPERGAYMALLWRQFDKGSVPSDAGELARAADMPLDAFEQLWQSKLAEKFTEHDGRLYNKTMLIEWISQAEYLIGNRERGRKGGKGKAGPANAVDDPFCGLESER